MFKKFFLFFIFCVFTLFPYHLKASGPDIKEGNWKITVKTEYKGEGMFQIPIRTYTQCITKRNLIPKKNYEAPNCKIIKNEVKGNKVSWIVECKTSKSSVVSKGVVTYKGKTFEGIIKIEHLGTEIIQHIKGKWIGECKY